MRDGVEVSTPSFEMTWGSTTSSGYCSQEDSDSEFEQYFTARTSFFRKPRKDIGKVRDQRDLKSARGSVSVFECIWGLRLFTSVTKV